MWLFSLVSYREVSIILYNIRGYSVLAAAYSHRRGKMPTSKNLHSSCMALRIA